MAGADGGGGKREVAHNGVCMYEAHMYRHEFYIVAKYGCDHSVTSDLSSSLTRTVHFSTFTSHHQPDFT